MANWKLQFTKNKQKKPTKKPPNKQKSISYINWRDILESKGKKNMPNHNSLLRLERVTEEGEKN